MFCIAAQSLWGDAEERACVSAAPPNLFTKTLHFRGEALTGGWGKERGREEEKGDNSCSPLRRRNRWLGYRCSSVQLQWVIFV